MGEPWAPGVPTATWRSRGLPAAGRNDGKQHADAQAAGDRAEDDAAETERLTA